MTWSRVPISQIPDLIPPATLIPHRPPNPSAAVAAVAAAMNPQQPSPTSDDLAAAGMFVPPSTVSTIPCCTCGTPIPPNPANMCPRCLRSRVDITDGLPRTASIVFCPDCRSYLQPPRTWLRAEPESKELLAFCLRRLTLRSVRLVHAEFIWTEPHSKRLKLRLRVQREALHGAILEQTHTVEITVHDRLCDSCAKANASPDQWTAAVQLRQNTSHRRTFFYLEQVILRHRAAAKTIRIGESDRGLDFYFSSRSHADRFIEFVAKIVPIRHTSSKELVSHDVKSSNYNYKYTFSVEICPICREDLICLPAKLAHSLGNLGPLVICTKVSNSITLLDPITLRAAFLDANQYWRTGFTSHLTSRQLVEYIVLDIRVESPEVVVAGTKYAMATAEVARVSDFGKNDNIFTVKTHIGHLLNPGDYAMGYDLYGANSNDIEVDKHKGLVLPDAVLIKKSYEEKRQKKRGKARPWKLKSLNVEPDSTVKGGKFDGDKRDEEYEGFLKDLEEHPELRFNVSLYRNKEYQPSEIASTIGDDDGEPVPTVPLEELLADLDISDKEGDDDDDDDDASMSE